MYALIVFAVSVKLKLFTLLALPAPLAVLAVIAIVAVRAILAARTVVNITPPTPKMLSVGQVYMLQLKLTSMLLVFCNSALSASALGICRTQCTHPLPKCSLALDVVSRCGSALHVQIGAGCAK